MRTVLLGFGGGRRRSPVVCLEGDGGRTMNSRVTRSGYAGHGGRRERRLRSPGVVLAALLTVLATLGGVALDGISGASAEAGAVTVTVTGTVLDGTVDGAPALEDASVQVFFLDVEQAFWVSVQIDESSVSRTDANGAFSLVLDRGLLAEGRHWVLTVLPPLGQDETTGVPARGATVFPLPALGPDVPGGDTVAAGSLTMLAPDVIGRVTDHVDTSLAVGDAFVTL